MRIFLTGASGFIGSHIAKAAHEKGYEVNALVRTTSPREHIEPFVTRFIVGDHASPDAWNEGLKDADAVIHNAFDSQTFRDGSLNDHLQSNVVSSIRLLEHSAPRPFVYMSSIAVHHDMSPRWDGNPDEDHPLRPSNNYGALKAAVEAHLWAAHFGQGRHAAAIRPCGVYGPHLHERHRSHGDAVIQGVLNGNHQPRDGGGKFVHVQDIANATLAALTTPQAAGKPFNLTDCYASHYQWACWTALAAGLPEPAAPADAPDSPLNVFSKTQTQQILGVHADRGHEGIKSHIQAIVADHAATK